MARKVPKPSHVGQGWPQERRNLAKHLMDHRFGRRYGAHRVFTWMLEAVIREVGQSIGEDPPEEALDDIREAVRLYRHCLETETPFSDTLGAIYMEIGRGNKYMGQFFTPEGVTTMMAMLTLDAQVANTEGRLITACDPAAGSGAMMLAMARCTLERYGTAALQNLSVTCVDLDYTCSLMCAAQLLGNAAIGGYTLGEIVVINGNSLVPSQRWEPIVHATRRNLVSGKDVAHAAHPARKEAVAAAAESSGVNLFPWYQTEEKEAV